MNILFRKGTSNSESNSNKDDSFVLQLSKETKNDDDDDDKLILTPTNNDKQIKNQTLLTQTVQQLFGKTSSSSSSKINSNQTNYTDEKMILDQNNPDEQLIDLN